MAPASPRSRRKEARPTELLEAALDTFVAKGYSATRVEDIAARAGVSKGTLYLYYPSKQAIFEALVRANLVPLIDRIEAETAADPGPAADQLRRIVATVQQIIANPRLVAIPKLVLSEAGNFPDLMRFYGDAVVLRVVGLLSGILRRGMARGEFRPIDPSTVVPLFVAPVIATALWQTTFAQVDGIPFDAAAVLDAHADLFLRGIAAEPEDGSRS